MSLNECCLKATPKQMKRIYISASLRSSWKCCVCRWIIQFHK